MGEGNTVYQRRSGTEGRSVNIHDKSKINAKAEENDKVFQSSR